MMSSALDRKTKTTEWKKDNIAIQVLREVSVTFPNTKHFIDEKLEEKC